MCLCVSARRRTTKAARALGRARRAEGAEGPAPSAESSGWSERKAPRPGRGCGPPRSLRPLFALRPRPERGPFRSLRPALSAEGAGRLAPFRAPATPVPELRRVLVPASSIVRPRHTSRSRRQQEARSYARSDTEADRAARTAAAQAAEARAAKFEQSAVGRAALKSVKAVKEERAQPPSRANNNIDDWRN